MSKLPSYFSQAHDFRIDTQNIITKNRNVYQFRGGHDPLDRLLGRTALGACYNSAERGADAPKCHPETRAAVQQEILSWIEHGDRDTNSKRLLWLSGPAGAGKTAIAGTIAEECYKKGWLAGSFFFSASSTTSDRRRKESLIATLAYQICEHEGLGFVKDIILASIDNNPAILDKRLDEQLEVLILNPLRKALKMGSSTTICPKVIIIDGLDECDLSLVHMAHSTEPMPRSEQEKIHLEILSVLERAANSSGFPGTFPFRIIISTRPEPVIRDFFSENAGTTQDVFLDSKYNPDADITLYLKAKFDAIRRRYEGLSRDWVSEEVIRSLVHEASGQFIYAATVVRFVETPERHPSQQLQRVLHWRQLDSSKPFDPLDLLYTRIIRTSPHPTMAVKWVGSIRYMDTEAQYMGAEEAPWYFIRCFLEEYPGEMRFLIGSLSSLLRLPSEDDSEPAVHFYHKSLFDFIENRGRSESVGLHITDSAILEFLRARYCAIAKNKGPQVKPVGLPPPKWLRMYAMSGRVYLYCNSGEYTDEDVDWWISIVAEHLQLATVSWLIPYRYFIAHRQVGCDYASPFSQC